MSFLDDVLDDSEFEPELTSVRELPEHLGSTSKTLAAPIRYVGADRARLGQRSAGADQSGAAEPAGGGRP